MNLCIALAAKTIVVAATSFTLSWEHSIEKIVWQEDWAVTSEGLVPTQARISGSATGVDPGPGARLDDGMWVWKPNLLPQRTLRLAASGATPGPWKLCAGETCFDFGTRSGVPVILSPCYDENL
ncbi:DUF1850 domain-containing protein [Puniceibacterium sp. IMCC21224]|uniref:DUF1850 domain-containing protein n=1 Tax=Puniceibacterium sp. IMCC21224 TaxID=1618204 RepID=UPI00064DC71D|nr:DUF1850 domain-containing protein [Puniceibacterium sp. IMCC21224]KMK69036.1 protein of unknown function (DUF1850) [Puniceibacterium sp. IMCC21224]